MSSDICSANDTGRPTNMRRLDQTIFRRKLQDRLFSILGVLATLVGLVMLAALLADLAVSGLGRIDWQFLTSYPSRFAHKAGVLSALVGTLAVMFVTAMAGGA